MYQISDVKLDSLRPGAIQRNPGRRSRRRVQRAHGAHRRAASSITRREQTVRSSSSRAITTTGIRLERARNNAASTGQVRVISEQEFWGFKDYGANLLAKLTPNRGLEYFAGYDFQNYSGQDDVLLIAPNTETRARRLRSGPHYAATCFPRARSHSALRLNAPTHSDSALVWNVSGRYDFTPNVFARGTVGTAFRYPDAYELFAHGSDMLLRQSEPEAGNEHERQRLCWGRMLYSGDTTVNVEVVGFYRTSTISSSISMTARAKRRSRRTSPMK